MENPTFKLEGVVKVKEELEDFEGPLTLILQLLSKNKIEIRDIRIAELLEQYMAYLDEMKAMDLEVASEFVSMASYLVYIKAKTLLDGEEDNSELQQLISSLESLKCKDTYALIKCVTDELSEMYRSGSGYIVKPPEYIAPDREYKYSHEKSDISEAIRRVLSREEAFAAAKNSKPFDIPHRIVYPVSEKADELLSKLREHGVLRAYAWFMESRSRSELVATFIALLELCRSGRVNITGEGDDFLISRADGEIINGEAENGNS
ncbi:MAG: segregation/condensation protein A [Oscillospiraceae bacterium]|nr:segregation/condensation protein A [Oscillospiraceae bacterium]